MPCATAMQSGCLSSAYSTPCTYSRTRIDSCSSMSASSGTRRSLSAAHACLPAACCARLTKSAVMCSADCSLIVSACAYRCSTTHPTTPPCTAANCTLDRREHCCNACNSALRLGVSFSTVTNSFTSSRMRCPLALMRYPRPSGSPLIHSSSRANCSACRASEERRSEANKASPPWVSSTSASTYSDSARLRAAPLLRFRRQRRACKSAALNSQSSSASACFTPLGPFRFNSKSGAPASFNPTAIASRTSPPVPSTSATISEHGRPCPLLFDSCAAA
mmetsp:Transcript_50607/g.81805  ORF Transcript_50607/g.81805 Transcript_50607/m.81805 type:complete len:277 (-) Transcript_50607:562-1392(-)